jgi:Ca-activated chloride channel family protein
VSPEPVASRRTPLIVAALVGLLAIAGVRFFVGHDDDSGGSNTDGSPKFQSRPGCTTLVVAASSEKAGLLAQLSADYAASGRTVNGTCYDIKVNTMASGAAEAALAKGWDAGLDGEQPDVWSPAASTWVGLLQQDLTSGDRPDLVPDDVESIARTPLVLAMPRPMAEALGWPKTPIGWGDVLKLANDPRGWAAKGHPEWGSFKLGKTNPNISTSGLAATVGAFVAATGRSSDLTERDLKDPEVRTFVRDVERSVVHYGDTTLTFLSNLQRADDAGSGLGYVSAVAVEEKSVLDYNAGNPTGNPTTAGQHAPPRVPLVAVYPKEGTLYSDNPYVVLQAPWVSTDKQAGARDFFDYLRTPDAQNRFTDAGFRSWEGKPGSAITNSHDLIADGVKITLDPPAPEVLDQVRSTWAQLRKPARVLLLLDVSGSMSQAVPNSGSTRLELAKAGLLRALGQFSPSDEVGVWMFTTDLGGPQKIYRELAPVRPIGAHRAEVEQAVEALTPLGGTPLYASIKAAVASMEASYDASKINAVVVLTDGKNEYSADNDLDGLVRQLQTGESGEGLRVFSIAYSPGADLDTLKRISEASQAAAYDATRPESIDKVMTAVISNF